MENIIKNIRAELTKNNTEEAKVSGQRFFKEEVKLYGVRNPIVHKLSKEYFKLIKSKTKSEIFDLCEMLWQSGFIEETIIACNWSFYVHKKYEPEDFELFEKWINEYVDNWATCDTFCNHTVGEFIVMYPEYLERLKAMAASENRWMRRGAAVSLIAPARKGKFLNEILEISDILLLDKEDMVQKGYGWMLKSASQAYQLKIFEYVVKNKAIMPRTALRYAIEKMPKGLRSEAMAK